MRRENDPNVTINLDDPYLVDLWTEWKNEKYGMKPWDYMGITQYQYQEWYYHPSRTSVVMGRQDPADVPPTYPHAHNHMTRDIRPLGSGCPACDDYHIHQIHKQMQSATETTT